MATITQRNDHLVYVGINIFGEVSVYIYVAKLSDHMNTRHGCDIYYPDHSTGIVSVIKPGFSPMFVVEELGWFSDPQLFGPICTNVPVPVNQADQTAAFNVWKNALVQDLDVNHAGLWTRNLH
jgi:hypothetical protein